jgi:diguanylate cyclase (GGDEF)-like protein
VAALVAAQRGAESNAMLGSVLREATLAWLAACCVLVAYAAERSVFSSAGVVRTLAVLTPLAWPLWLGRPETKQAVAALHHSLEGFRLGVVGPGLLCATLAGLILAGRVLVQGSPLDGSLTAVIAALALVLSTQPSTAAACAAAGGLVLVFGLVHESHRLAFRDELTELPGRRALNEALAALDGDCALAMVDVDHFKKFNDTHGHDVGDQVLRLVAGQLRDVGGGGRAFRYGGEEFTVLFAGRSASEALPHLESLREAVEHARLTLRSQQRPKRKPKHPPRQRGSKQVSVTVSIGVAAGNVRSVAPQQLLKAADKALYKAKRNGRNQVAR